MAIQTTEQSSDDQMEVEKSAVAASSSSNEQIPSISQQRKTIKEHLERRLDEGDVWCLVDRRWLDSWKNYVNYDKELGGDEQEEDNTTVGDSPGSIDNTVLLQTSVDGETTDPFMRKLNRTLSFYDYEIITQEGFQLLQQWYGGGPEIARKVIIDNRSAIVELHPYFLLLGTNKGADIVEDKYEFTEVSFSKQDTLEDVLKKAKELFNIDASTQTRFWRAEAFSPYERIPLSEMSEELTESGFKNTGQQLLVEVQLNNEWQIEVSDSEDSDDELLSSNPVRGSTLVSQAAVSSVSVGGASNYTSSAAARSSYSSWSNDGDNRGSDPGVCGLSNLGNTCFMNSALQCLTKTPQIINYFCKDEYIPEINTDNPLGMGGKIASAFGSLMKEMWSGKHSYVSPREFKHTIGKFAPQFSGYQQQDSQELIAYLLDGLHEDLNRILKKPYTEQVESNGRPDDVVADESWVNHLKRNDSIIVDKFQGQLKSTLVCPKCEGVSITFDPYMYLSLPLPVETSRALNVTVFQEGKVPTQYQVKVPKKGMLSEFRAAIAQMCGIEDAKRIVIFEVFSGKLYKFLSDKSEIKSIFDNDILHAHVVPSDAELADDLHMQYSTHDTANIPFLSARFITIQKEERVYYSGSSYKNVNIGSPFVIHFNKEKTTNKDLYDFCFNYIKPYINFEVAQKFNIDLDVEDKSSIFPDITYGRKNKQQKQEKSYGYDDDDDDYYGSSSRYYTTRSHWNDSDDEMRDDDASPDEKSDENGENGDNRDNGEDQEKMDNAQTPTNEEEEEEQKKFNFFYLKFDDSTSYMSSAFNEDNESGVLPYTDDIIQLPRERMMGDKKAIMMFMNPDVVSHLIDVQALTTVERHESTLQRQKSTGVSLDACVELFTKQEQLGEEDTWYCPRCKEFVQATKKFDIWSLPEVLVIHLKRFQYNKYSRDKLDTFIDYPLDDFDLAPHVLQNQKNKNSKYTLFAVSNHFGGLGGGHYTAYAKLPNGQWYLFDDSSVRGCQPEDAKTSAGYVLFYHRKKTQEEN